jgi:hypothetical protein
MKMLQVICSDIKTQNRLERLQLMPTEDGKVYVDFRAWFNSR